MGGEIFFESTEGQGTTFTFLLNLKTKEAIASNNRESKMLQSNKSCIDYGNMKVLVIDDNLINREIMKEMIEDFGMNITLCDNGRDRIDILKKQHVDLILLDIHMPEMNGIEVLEKIQEIQIQHPFCIIFLTSLDIENKEMKDSIESVDGYLVKPIMRKDLIHVIDGCMNRKLISKERVLAVKEEDVVQIERVTGIGKCDILPLTHFGRHGKLVLY